MPTAHTHTETDRGAQETQGKWKTQGKILGHGRGRDSTILESHLEE